MSSDRRRRTSQLHVIPNIDTPFVKPTVVIPVVIPVIDHFASINVDIAYIIFQSLNIFDQVILHHMFGQPRPSQFKVAMAMLVSDNNKKSEDDNDKGLYSRGRVSRYFRNQNIPIELQRWEYEQRGRNEMIRKSLLSEEQLWEEELADEQGYQLEFEEGVQYDPRPLPDPYYGGYFKLPYTPSSPSYCPIDWNPGCFGRLRVLYLDDSCHCGYNCQYCDRVYPSDMEEQYAHMSAWGLQTRFPSSYTPGDYDYHF